MIFGITGFKEHGKDAFATFMVMHSGGQYRVTHFADRLKVIVREVFSLTASLPKLIAIDDYLDPLMGMAGLKLKPLGLVASSPRELLQYIGTEYIRGASPSYWLDIVAKEMIQGNIIIADVRYLNEARLIMDKGGKIIRITRPTDGVTEDMHISERENAQIKADYIVENRSTLDFLSAEARKIVVATGGCLS